MKSTLKQTPRNLVSILDSDDEFPDTYEETSEVPAYLNDSRFDHIQLPWLKNCKTVEIKKTQPELPLLNNCESVEIIKTQLELPSPDIKASEKTKTNLFGKPILLNENDKSRILISEGLLTTRDLFFVKSIEGYCSESTLIWFIESLKSKSTQNRFRKSCLIEDFYHANYNGNELEAFDSFYANYYFKLIVY